MTNGDGHIYAREHKTAPNDYAPEVRDSKSSKPHQNV